jgi:hypothetical protein
MKRLLHRWQQDLVAWTKADKLRGLLAATAGAQQLLHSLLQLLLGKWRQ